MLVALAEQARLDYDPPAPASVPARHAAFAMLCDARPAPVAGRPDTDGDPVKDGAPLLRAVRVLPGVAAGQVPAILRRELAGLPVTQTGQGQCPLVLGEGLAPLVGGDVPGWRPVPLPPGQPLTGTWRELAAWAAVPGRGGLVIADYDPGLRYLCLAAFTGT